MPYWGHQVFLEIVMHTITSLKQEFKTITAAKQHFGLKARGWQALADKLNQQAKDDLIAQLQAEVAQLKQENEALRQQPVTTGTIAFWLTDGNFERSRFTDFDVPEMALLTESSAKAFCRKLAKRVKGNQEQLANVDRLLNQMLVMVDLHGMTA
jgi:hypothetical protein